MKKTYVGLDLEVKRILLKEWDPIGISEIPEADDEYDAYVQHVSGMIQEHKTVEEIYAYLRWIEVERICLDGDDEHTRKVANKLTELHRT